VVDGKVYQKSGWFFVNGTRASLKKVVSTRVIQIVDQEIMVRTIDYPQVKITFSANCVIKPGKAAEVLGTYTTEEQIRTEVISVLSTFTQGKSKNYISMQKADFQRRLADEFADKISYLNVKVLRATDYSEHEASIDQETIKAGLQTKTALQQKVVEAYIDEIRRQEISAGRNPSQAVLRGYAEIEKQGGVEAFLHSQQATDDFAPGNLSQLASTPLPNRFETALVRATALSEFRLIQSEPPYTLAYLGYKVILVPQASEPGAIEITIFNPEGQPIGKTVKRKSLEPLLVELQSGIQAFEARRKGA
jgi:hypothetical protein